MEMMSSMAGSGDWRPEPRPGPRLFKSGGSLQYSCFIAFMANDLQAHRHTIAIEAARNAGCGVPAHVYGERERREAPECAYFLAVYDGGTLSPLGKAAVAKVGVSSRSY